MAHARMCGIFRQGGIDPASIDASSVDLAVLDTLEERELAKQLVDFPSLVVGAADALEPHRIAAYLQDTAGLAHRWYHEHHVLDQPEPLRTARLVLARATQIVLRNALGILGISAPERM
jgi:arginyl-tRNA synthetase